MGLLAGAWIVGMLADMIGRRKVFIISTAGVILFALCYSLAPGFYSFAFFRMATAFCYAGHILSSYVLVMELVGISQRTVASLMINIAFGIGYVVLTILAYLVPKWRTQSIIGAAIGIPFLLLWRYV